MKHPRSIINDCGEYPSSCGYCTGKQGTGINHGMEATTLTASDYQDLIDQGWRRSGAFLYKPNLEIGCCKQYTIRQHAVSFQPTKEQNRVLRKFERYLKGQQEITHPVAAAAPASREAPGPTLDNAQAAARQLQQLLHTAVLSLINRDTIPEAAYPPPTVHTPTAKALKALPPCTSHTSSCAFAIAAAARKLLPSFSQTPATLAAELAAAVNSTGLGFRAAAANGHINFSPAAEQPSPTSDPSAPSATPTPPIPIHPNPSTTASSPHPTATSPASPPHKRPTHTPRTHPTTPPTALPACSTSPQQPHNPPATHNTTPTTATTAPLQPPPLPSTSSQSPPVKSTGPHTFEMKIVPSQFLEAEYQLYRQYQINQHHDEPSKVTRKGYKDFLCNTPIIPVPPSADDPSIPPTGYGSFHQQYWLDGTLIAVGVIDILPRCLSSVYLFWHPDYAHLAPGKLSALKEIQWVVEAHRGGCSQLQWYYMGFYVPTCHKMRYKGDYNPSDLLCPRNKVWVRLTPEIRATLDAEPYQVLSELPGALTQPNLALPPASSEAQPGNSQAGALGRQQQQQQQQQQAEAAGRGQGLGAKLQQLLPQVENVVINLGATQLPLKVLLPAVRKEVMEDLVERVYQWAALVGPRLAPSIWYSVA